MATLNNGGNGNRNSGHQHDGQKNYQHSNERNPDHARNDTQKHHYKEHEETLTNDANFDAKGQPKVDMEFDDKDQNVDQ